MDSNDGQLVFKGPVYWTAFLTKTGLDLTAKDRFFGPVQSSLTSVQLKVQQLFGFYKDRSKTSLDQSRPVFFSLV